MRVLEILVVFSIFLLFGIIPFQQALAEKDWIDFLTLGEFGNSVWEEQRMFKIPYWLSNGSIEKIEGFQGGLDILIKNESSDSDLMIKIPRNFPFTNSNQEWVREDLFVLVDGHEITNYVQTKSDCFYEFSISLPKNSTEVVFAWATTPAASLPFRGGFVPSDCVEKTIDKTQYFSKFLPPKKQIQKGIWFTNVICSEGLEFVLKASKHTSACVKPESIPKLIERGWAKSE